MKRYLNSQEAFLDLYENINQNGMIHGNTKMLFNIGFYIENPLDRIISVDWRKWNEKYAEFEWQWYLSQNPDATEISKKAPIWKKHMDKKGHVRSNYGWQWNRNNQFNKVVNKLKYSLENDIKDRQCVISIYDGKEIDSYKYDTPCTLSIHFQIVNQSLCMTVNMRSNDLWFGFCNDQYCFSKLQEMIANAIGIKIGWYFHFASNLHLYSDKLNKS